MSRARRVDVSAHAIAPACAELTRAGRDALFDARDSALLSSEYDTLVIGQLLGADLIRVLHALNPRYTIYTLTPSGMATLAQWEEQSQAYMRRV